MDSKFGAGLKSKLDALGANPDNTGDTTPNSPNPTRSSGGISVKLDLLPPDIKEGDTVNLTVESIDPDTNEAHLTVESPQ